MITIPPRQHWKPLIGVPMENPVTAVKVQAAKTAEAAKTTEEAAK